MRWVPQARYAAGVKDILERFFDGRKLNETDVILEGGKMAAQYDHVRAPACSPRTALACMPAQLSCSRYLLAPAAHQGAPKALCAAERGSEGAQHGVWAGCAPGWHARLCPGPARLQTDAGAAEWEKRKVQAGH